MAAFNISEEAQLKKMINFKIQLNEPNPSTGTVNSEFESGKKGSSTFEKNGTINAIAMERLWKFDWSGNLVVVIQRDYLSDPSWNKSQTLKSHGWFYRFKRTQ
jgi:hypothetical protein